MKKVLVIDDDVTFQLTMGQKLKECGYAVATALDGEAGLKEATEGKPDLILLDIKMPKLDGLSLLRELQEGKSEAERIPVFITSNLPTLENISEGVTLGIKGFIVKSDESLDTIMTALKSVLEHTPADKEAA